MENIRKEHIRLLTNINSLSLEEIIYGYRMSLALFDKESSIKFKMRYVEYYYKYFLKIFLNIEKEQTYDLFINSQEEWQEEWQELIYKKEVLIGICLKKIKDNSKKEILLKALNNSRYMYKLAEEEKRYNFVSISNLIGYLFNLMEDGISRRRQNIIASIAMHTDDINIAKKIRKKLKDSDFDFDSLHIIDVNIARLVAEKDINKALDQLYLAKNNLGSEADKCKYNIAKRLLHEDYDLACSIIRSLPSKYTYGFEAYQASENFNKKKIVNIIEILGILLKEGTYDEDKYDHTILEVGFAIAKNYPSFALQLREKLHENWYDIVDLQVEIAILQSKKDFDKGLKYINEIEVEKFRSTAIFKIIKFNEEYDNLMKIKKMVKSFEFNTNKFEALYILSQKMDIEYDEVFEVVKDIMPYEYLYDFFTL